MANELTPAALDEIATRCEKATPGPWKASDDVPSDVVIWGPREDWLANVGNWARMNPNADAEETARQYVELSDRNDAAFIAAARSDVPALITALRAAWAEVERVREDEQEEILSLVTTLREMAGDDGGDGDETEKAACANIRGTCNTIIAAIRARDSK